MIPKMFSFLLVPSFSLVTFSCAVDALRGANLVLGNTHYRWQAVSSAGGMVTSTSMLQLPTVNFSEAEKSDVIVVCGGDRSHLYEDRSAINWMQKHANSNVKIGSISDGAFVAAAAGLFDRCASTIHWKCQDAYREKFPELDIRASIMEISEKRFSCAGGTASLDLMLHFISEEHGHEVSSQIAKNYFHDAIRDSSSEQHVTNAYLYAGKNPSLGRAMLLMEAHLENCLTIADIAAHLDISRRQLDRIFRRYLDCTPQDYYRNLRLNRASGLLLQTNMDVTEVALGCGFQSASHLATYFRRKHGATPGAWRRMHNYAARKTNA